MMNKYLDIILRNIKSNLLLILVSFLIYIFWYIYRINSLFSHSYLYISLGHIGYFFLLLIPAFWVIRNNLLQKLWIFFSGLAILDLVPLMYIVNNKNIDPSIFTSSITLTLIIFLILISMLYSISKPTDTTRLKTKPKSIYLVFLSSLFFILLYHGSNYYLKIYKNVPNEERSIFINSLEFHHINYGLIFLTLVPFLFKYASSFTKNLSLLTYLFIGFIYGTVFDECYYYMLANMTDDAYLYPNIFFIQIIFMSFVFLLWFYLLKKEGKAYA